MKLAQKYIDVLEAHDWAVSSYTNDGRVELETYSPAGEDFCICVEVENFPKTVMEYWEDFDPDEHAEELILARRNGFQGVPSASVLTNDAQAIDNMILELAHALAEADEVTDLSNCDEATKAAILKNDERLAAREKIMGKDDFRKWIYENYNVPGNNCTLAPAMLDGILDYADGMDGEQRFILFNTVFPSIPTDIIRRVDY